MSATIHALVESLFWCAFPGDQPHPDAAVTVKSETSVEIVLDGPESPLARVLALALLAAELGDEDGPEVIPGVSRYTCGEFQGVFFLISTPVTAEMQAELEALALRMVDGE